MKPHICLLNVLLMAALAWPSSSSAMKSLYAVEDEDRGVQQLNPLTGDEGFQCRISGGGANGITGMAAHPTTGDFYVAVETTGSNTPKLTRLDIRTCVTTDVGDLGDLVTGLAFDSGGTLYAVTSDDVGGTTDTLFTVDLGTAALTLFMALPGPDGFGDTIAFNPGDGLLYHLTGEMGNGSVAFNAINLSTMASTPISLSGNRPAGSAVRSFTWDSDNGYFVGYRGGAFGVPTEYFSITTTGVQASLSAATGMQMAGIAFYDTGVLPDPAPLASGRNLYSADSFGPYVSQLDPSTGDELGLQAITIPGSTIFGFNGLAFDATTGEMYGVVRFVPGGGGRSIIKLDPASGVGELVGNTGERIAAIAFDSSGTLYAASTENPIDLANPETLYTVSKTDGSLTPFTAMGGGESGEALAFNSNDGDMYRASGDTNLQSIDLVTKLATNIPYSGDMQAFDVAASLTYDAVQDLFLGWRFTAGPPTYFSVSPAGVVTDLGSSDISRKGMAFSVDASTVDQDTDGDRKSDILFRNNVTGANQLYLMDGTTISQNLAVTTVSADWQAVGRGDYNGDGKADILWRFNPTGAHWIFLMDGNSVTSSLFVATIADSNWQVVGNGDYNGDLKSDILWRHQTLGTVWLYQMDSNTITLSTGIGVVPDANWQIVGSGDYNGDGKSDLLWRNVATGTNWMYLMDGASITTSIGVSVTPDLNWQIVGNGDLNGDGKSDILWRHAVNGTNWAFLMNGTAIATSASVSVLPDTNWVIVGDGDYNGDGKSDVLWRNMSTGSNFMYLMDGLSITTNANVSVVTDQNWQIVNTN